MMMQFFKRQKSPTTPDNTPATVEEQSAPSRSLFQWLKNGLSRTRAKLAIGLGRIFLGKKEIDAALYADIEKQLLLADVGIQTTQYILNTLTEQASRQTLKDPSALFENLKEILQGILLPCEDAFDIHHHRPFVLLVVGANGNGKTTTIGKIANQLKSQGHSVLLAAGDTFRAAAVAQLRTWGDRLKIPVIAQHDGADSAAVIFDAFQSAKAQKIDVLIADTAGRLHTRQDLMQELQKIKRVLQKLDPHAPHEIMLVLDAGTGQNALIQAKTFKEALGIHSLTLTKLDGTAQGGMVFTLAQTLGLPIRYLGVGEGLTDLQPFSAAEFIRALFDEASGES